MTFWDWADRNVLEFVAIAFFAGPAVDAVETKWVQKRESNEERKNES